MGINREKFCLCPCFFIYIIMDIRTGSAADYGKIREKYMVSVIYAQMYFYLTEKSMDFCRKMNKIYEFTRIR